MSQKSVGGSQWRVRGGSEEGQRRARGEGREGESYPDFADRVEEIGDEEGQRRKVIASEESRRVEKERVSDGILLLLREVLEIEEEKAFLEGEREGGREGGT